MTGSYINLAAPCLDDEDWLALKEPLASGWLTQGPKVRAFEEAFARRHQTAHALAATSCTTALHLALAAIGIKPGDRVIVPSFTWIATANVVEYCGATPVFCDSGLDDYNLDPAALADILGKELKAGRRPKALIAVHLFGLMADMGPIMDLAGEHGLTVIEDAACAAGAAWQGRAAGSLGAIGCFSFHPRKIITVGEGGMCLTNDPELAEKMACLRSHGASVSEEQRHGGGRPYLLPDFNVLGFNYRMSDLQGAMGLTQLAKLDRLIAQRRQAAAFYQKRLEHKAGLILPRARAGFDHSWQSYVVRIDPAVSQTSRDEIMAGLEEAGIASRPGTHAIHELGYYRNKYGLKAQDFPTASALYHQTLTLPLHHLMTDEDYERVASALERLA
ncbi:DegT/DnrJ/EryC1/StrS family aminotransferase [Deltaproteobacteria bacterium OttesenSCG-928-K17]|nr:DegT/DnrJ/EryC1/StrS family aminotransferase [Deltaproteobacteria bacterium OttesenSCG-928-K17]